MSIDFEAVLGSMSEEERERLKLLLLGKKSVSVAKPKLVKPDYVLRTILSCKFCSKSVTTHQVMKWDLEKQKHSVSKGSTKVDSLSVIEMKSSVSNCPHCMELLLSLDKAILCSIILGKMADLEQCIAREKDDKQLHLFDLDRNINSSFLQRLVDSHKYAEEKSKKEDKSNE